MPRLLLLLVSALLLAGCTTTDDTAPVYHASAPLGGKPAPFSEAVTVGRTLYLAGQIGNKPGTRELAPGGLEGETRQTLDNVRAILERHGATLDDVVKVTVMLADIKDWPAFNEIYVQYFRKNLPARSALGANGLALGARVEVEAIAVLPARR